MKKLTMFICFNFVLVYIFSISSLAETLDEVEQSKSSVDNKLEYIEKMKKKQREDLATAVERRAKLAETLKKMDAERRKINSEKQKKEDELIILEDLENDALKRYDDAMKVFKTRLRSMYVNSGKSMLDILLDCNNLVEFTSRVYILKNIAKKDKDIVDDFKTAKKDVEYKRKLKQVEQAALESKLDQTKSAIKAVNANQNAAETKIKDINSRLKKLEMEEDRLQEASKALGDKIKSFNSKRKFVGGSMVWPCPSSDEISSSFGFRFHPVLKTRRFHSGIDIAAGYGSSLVAVNAGVVLISGWEDGYGNTVVIDHGGGITTLYGHCSKLVVGEGKNVASGETIARVGSTGISTGPHLHFEVRNKGEPDDPMKYFGK